MNMMILLASIGILQLLIGVAFLRIIIFYIWSLVKLWKSTLSIGNKVVYTLIVFLFPIVGLLLLILIQYNVLFRIEPVNLEK